MIQVTRIFKFDSCGPPGELDLSENPLSADGAKELAKALSFLAAIFLAKDRQIDDK